MSKAKRNSFWGSIKGNIISYVTLCTMIIIVVTAVLNSVVMRNILITNGHSMLVREAENTGKPFFSGFGSQHKGLVEGCDRNGRFDLY